MLRHKCVTDNPRDNAFCFYSVQQHLQLQGVIIMRSTLYVLTFALLLTTGLSQATNLGNNTKRGKTVLEVTAQYSSPMHPAVKSDKAGKCPKYGMELVLAENRLGRQTAGRHDRKSAI